MVEPPARSPSPALPLPPRRSGMVRALLVLSMLFLPLGLTLPVLETTRLWVFKESYSLVDAVRALFEAGEIALAMLIALFSLVTPALKLIAVSLLHICPPANSEAALPRWIERLGKWSLTDVLVVAVLIVVWSGTGLQLAVQPGLWFFAACAVMTMSASGLVVRDLKRRLRASKQP